MGSTSGRSEIAQARLKSGVTTTVAWIDLVPGVRKGAVISFKGSTREWTILSLGAAADASHIPNLGRRYQQIERGAHT